MEVDQIWQWGCGLLAPIMEDGTPPPEPAAIEVVCVAHRIPQTYTDSKGKFSFRLGEHQEVTSDASLGAGSDRDILGGRRGGRQSGSTTSMARAGAGMFLGSCRSIVKFHCCE